MRDIEGTGVIKITSARGGFTLLEVLICLAIIGISFGVVFTEMSLSKRMAIKADRKMTIEIPPDVMTEMSSDERLGILGMRRVLAEYLLKYVDLDEVIFIDHFIRPKEIIKETPVLAPVEAEKTSEDESTSSQPAKK